MTKIKEGITASGDKYASYVCSNKEAGCDFFETKYGDLTPPGILITEEMTAQDIEKLREERRNNRIPILPHAAVAPHTIIRGFDPASEDDMDDNGMSRYMENNDEEGWD